MLRGLLLITTILATADLRPEASFHVIVHRTSRVESLSRAQLSAIFMRRVPNWQPIDQFPTSRVREDFSRAIHQKSGAYVVRYWQRLIFSGRGVPPPEARSDAAVIDFVRKNPNAIGYIASTPSSDVKVVSVTR